tara:strand:- start:17389 stop:17691 length:303 start_codon:yes stop_codon:yes gene_type:complete
MTKEDIQRQAQRFDAKLKSHPSNSSELIKLLAEFGEQIVKKDLIAGVVELLPTDEDINWEAHRRTPEFTREGLSDEDEVDGGFDGFRKGANWMKQKITGQ